MVVVSWAGMRGAVSLAAALALALDFPDRDLVIFLTFCVILATLVGQGLTLPWLVRRLGVVATDGPDTEEAHARLAAVEAALRRLDDLEMEYPGHKELIDQLRSRFEHEAGHVWPGTEGPLDEAEQERLDHLEIRNAVLDAERDAIIALRDDGIIGDEVLHRIERDLDLEVDPLRGLSRALAATGVLAFASMSIVDAAQYLFTSESVTEGHPDKMCDQVSDAILDAIIREDPNARVACETATTTGLVMVLGEISTDDLHRHPGRRPRHRPRHRLHPGRLRLRLPDLRHADLGQGAVARHRPGRRLRRSRSAMTRRRRSSSAPATRG